VFGEIALFDEGERSATVTALTETTAFTLANRDFTDVLQHNPAAMRALLAVLARRIRHSTGHIEDLVFLDLPGRVAKCLIDQDELLGNKGVIALTQEDVASFVGATRVAVNRVLVELERRGALRLGRGNITIVANNFLLSTDSLVSASSQLGISGTIELIGPRVDLNGSLVTLSGDLHGAARVARDNCGAKGGLRSSLVDSGRGGLPQDADATIPALYLAGRGADRPWHAGLSFAPEGFSTPALAATRQIYSASARLDMNCH